MSIKKQMEKVRQLDKSGERQAAFSLLKEIINEQPDNANLWSLQGSLYARDKNYDEAVKSLDKAIVLMPEEARFYYHRARYFFSSDNILEAINDFSDALIRDNYGDITFTEEIYFHRAEAFIKLGKKKEALLDISHINDDYQTWTFRLRTKADLVVDCSKL